eukprot:TRINITY_DN1929_c0_g1_i1.p1 TRINITY_DN1929_c0_g1~~TRINITY_DN1929_c0_g1_i1.p1  ORF type:complete len:302 (-),score=17.45 TRINITY_DN1929_c0_g1_i1:45-950(-)
MTYNPYGHPSGPPVYNASPYPAYPATAPAVPTSYSSSPKYVARVGVPPAPGSTVKISQTIAKKPGLFGSLTKALDTSLADVSHSIQKAASHIPIDTSEEQTKRFRANFSLSVSEKLVFEVPCKAATQNSVMNGHLYLSTNFLCFTANALNLQVVIPLAQIISINHAVQASRSVVPEVPLFLPEIQASPLERSSGAGHALECYTMNQQVHIFFSLPSFDKTLASLEYGWNTSRSAPPPPPQPAAAPVMYAPSPYPQYAPPPTYPQYAPPPTNPQYTPPPVNPQYAPSAPPFTPGPPLPPKPR